MGTDRARGSEGITFRVAQSDDESLLREMLYLAVFVPPGETPPPSSVIEQPEVARYVSGWGRQGDDGVIALKAGDRAIGAAWIRLWPDDDRGYGFVDVRTPELSVALRPAYRGLGIGTQLIQHLLHRVDTTYPCVSLSVSALNPAVRLYERLGFTTISATGASITMKRLAVRPGAM